MSIRRPTWCRRPCRAGPWPLDPLPLEASLPPVRRCLLRLRGRQCGRFLLLRLIIVTEIISQHSISSFLRQVFTRLRMENQYTHLMRGLQHECRQCYAFSTDMEVVLVCTGLDGRKRGESESLNNLKKAQVHYLECEKLRVNKKLKSPK